MNIKRENTEFRTQTHEMWLEGSCDDEPTEREIMLHAQENGFQVINIETWYDTFQNFWRFNADIQKL